jgi:cytochrome c2
MTSLKIVAFTILVAAFYSYVGQMVPQKETYPPADTEIGADMTPAELAAAGEEIVGGKGTCLTCHTMGQTGSLRFPDLAGIGARAGSTKEGFSDIEYLGESLYDPNAYIVEGFLGGMPPIGKPPIALSDLEILAVIAYLQSLGGESTVTTATELEWQGQEPAAATSGSAGAAAAPAGDPRSGEALFTAGLCNTCHKADEPGPLVGPSLFDVGARLTRSELYEAVVEPDATVAEGFPSGIMSATLNGMGFTDGLSPAELKNLVDYLASKQGG